MVEKQKGISIAGMVLGICSIVFIWVPILDWILAIVGLILSIVALSKIKKEPAKYDGKGMAIAGLVTSIIALVILVVFVIIALLFMAAAGSTLAALA